MNKHYLTKFKLSHNVFCGIALIWGFILFRSTVADAQFFYNESCRNATGAFSYYGQAPGYTATGYDSPGDGWLRLTNNTTNQRGYVRLDKTFPSTMGVTVEFDFKVWAPSIYGGAFADGFSVFLYDADPAKTFQIGGTGSHLGYVGLTPAYLGIGIDEFGGFSGTYGIGGHAIAIRDYSYQLVDGTGINMGIGKTVAYTTVTSTRPVDGIYYRRVRIEIEPAVFPATGMDVTVYIRTEDDPSVYTNIIGPVNVPDEAPDALGLGFSGATGSSYAYHEVRDVIIRTPGSLSVYQTADCANSKDNVTIHTHVIHGYPTNTQNIIVHDTLPVGYIPAGTPTLTYTGPSASMGSATVTTSGDGRQVYTYPLSIEDISEATVSYTGSFATMPSQGEYHSGVSVELPQGFNDVNLNDNQFHLTAYIEKLKAATPVSQPFISGDVLTFGVSATHTADIAYRWKVSSDKILWTDIPGINTASYTTPALAGRDLVFYRCIAEWRGQCRDSILFNAVPTPDNVSDAECFIEPSSFEWAITEDFKSAATDVSTYVSPVVGDLDDDGIPEILVAKFISDSNSDRLFKGIYIYWGDNRSTPTFVDTQYGFFGGFGFSIARVNISGVMKPIIVMTGHYDGYLYAYDPDPAKTTETQSRIWTSDVPCRNYAKLSIYSIMFTDFDRDGTVEIVAGNQIFAAESGIMIVDGPAAGNTGYAPCDGAPYKAYFPAIADVTGDGFPDYVAGTEVYTVNINSRTDDTQNSMTLTSNITAPTINGIQMQDGNTAVVDINRDGILDVVTLGILGATTYGLMAWTPQTQTLIATAYGTTVDNRHGMPFIGNIDNEPNLEILFVLVNKIVGYRWNGAQSFTNVYNHTVTDGSGMTGITLFDFNNDNVMELVYRDEQNLRIMHANSTTGTFTDLETIAATSGTVFDHPVVADVDNDGAAEIVTVGGTAANALQGTMRIYKSGNQYSWAPARKVWNQYAYNVVNVNEDLTVPLSQFNLATVFPGIDEQGTSDDVQPFNAFLQQATAISKNGTPLWLAPDASFAGAPAFNYHADGDSLVVTLQVTNTGDAALQATFYVSAYKNDATVAANKMATDSSTVAVNAGDTKPLTLTIRNLSGYLPLTDIIIRINDKGGAAYVQSECDDSDNTFTKPFAGILMARHDTATAINAVSTKIAVRQNDLIPSGCTAPVFAIVDAPLHGAASIVNDSVQYLANDPDFSGRDSLTYRIVCGSDTSTARVFIIVYEMPDNVSDAECYVEPTAHVWSIKEDFKSNETDVSTYVTPIVGDLNGDGIPEILVAKYLSDDGNNRKFQGIYIYWGHNRSTPTLVNTVEGFYVSFSFSIARVKINNVYRSMIVMPGHNDGYLYAYDPDPAKATESASRIWKSDQPLNDFVVPTTYSIGFIDFDGDGEVEIYAGSRIYDAATGKFLAEVPSGGNKGFTGQGLTGGRAYFSYAADVDGDGKPEFLAGTQAYTVNINSRTTASSNSMSLLASIPDVTFTGYPNLKDGATMVADINRDGRLDVIVFRVLSSTQFGLVAWDVQTRQLIGKATSVTTYSYASIPFIGNVDNNPDLEILLLSRQSSNGEIKGFRLNTTTATFDQVYILNVNDGSGMTGITLFDFNQDDIMELVYRDEQNLRIMQANSSGSFTNLKTIAATSGTSNEYPVVADVDNDGAAEIVTVGGSTANALQGTMRIYKSETEPWAPARKVWNQYAYNVVNVNEDLTIPAVQFNPAIVFPGKDEQLGTSDDVQPFNAFLQQQTVLNKNGVPVWLVPNSVALPPQFEYDAAKDSATIHIAVANIGDAAFRAPFYVTAYKNNAQGMPNYTYPYPNMIMAGDTAIITFGISGFKANGWVPFDHILIRTNDSGNGYSNQSVCDSAFIAFETSSVIAVDDRVLVAKNSAGNRIFVSVNDLKPCAGSDINLEIISGGDAKHGSATVQGDSVIVYKPSDDYLGMDTVKYRIFCTGNTDTDTATVYINVMELPDNVSDADCFINPSSTLWTIRELPINTTDHVHNYSALTAGDIDGDGTVEIIAFSNVAAPGTTTNYPSRGIKIFTVENERVKLKHSFNFANAEESPGGISTWTSMAIARYNDKGYIVVMGQDRYLYAYHPNGDLAWKNQSHLLTNMSFPTDVSTMVNITDFNGDGIPEIYTGNQVFDLRNGHLLCEGTGNMGEINRGYSTVAADIDGDGLPEICAGTQIYKVHIDPDMPMNNSITVMNDYTLPTDSLPPANEPNPNLKALEDGGTQVADIDNDGQLEIVVLTRKLGMDRIFAYVWKPQPNGGSFLMGYYKITITGIQRYSIPMIGNIDDTPYPEIVFITDGGSSDQTSHQFMYALKYDPSQPAGDRIKLKWKLKHTDESGATGMSLFDFNLDGVNEIVYRGQTQLRIIDGDQDLPNEPQVLKTFDNVTSGTLREFPLIADVDSDGQAEIVVTGNTFSQGETGYLRVFKSDGFPWAPARKVWNQYAYNAVNINEDLTVPRYQLNPATVFPGKDGLLGTSDDVRPYNAFLQQATALSKNGTPLWLAPNGQIVGSPAFNYDATIDSMTVTVKVHNAGDAAFQPPFKITVYRNNTGNAQKKYIYSYPNSINAGETAEITFGISGFKAGWMPFSKLVIRINDSGNGYSDQEVCDSAFVAFETGAIIAVDDRVQVANNSDGNRITVTRNDIKPASCTAPKADTINGGGAKHGTVYIVNDSVIVYTPDPDYLGMDTVVYRIHCGDPNNGVDTATVYIKVMEMPDNITDADCFTLPPPSEWSIREVTLNNDDLVHNYGPLTVGDIDNDGTVEILGFMETTGTGADYPSTGIKIFYYDNNEEKIKLKNSFSFSSAGGVDVSTHGAMAIARYNGTGHIVVAGVDHYLYAYDPNGSRLWTSDNTINTKTTAAANVNIADFNGDGIPEVYTGNKIFSLHNGHLICDGGTGNNVGILSRSRGLSTMAADIDGDGVLELCAGTQIYGVNIDPGSTAGTMSVIAGMELTETLPVDALADGATQVADIDNDGQPEIIVISKDLSATTIPAVAYVWKPLPNSRSYIMGSYATDSTLFYSVPMIGNIDGTPYPEIVFIGSDLMYALKFDPAAPAGQQILLKWTLPHTDFSASTGMTLFDFNQDGVNEIVYRDQTELRIIDGSGSSATTKTAFDDVVSGTLREFPVIADIDGDGQAEIIVTGWDNIPKTIDNMTANGQRGYVRVFKSDGDKWAPARKVWNQYAYNAVNINEDLTVPAVQFNPATVFPGPDGMLGTSDDVRPYNAFLQQATALSKNGTPLWLTPDAEIYGTPAFNYHADGDSLVVSLQITNTGDAALQAPFYVSAYKNTVDAANVMATDSSTVALNAGDTKPVILTVRNLSTYLPFTDILIRINDKGGAAYVQSECDYAGNELRHPFAGILMARHDTVKAVNSIPLKIAVKQNDIIPSGCTAPVFAVVADPLRGTATIVNDSVRYLTNDPDFSGHDSLTYRISCNGDTSTAKVYIMVYDKPDNIVDADCFIAPDATEWIIQRHQQVDTVPTISTFVVGDINDDTYPDIVAYTKNNTAIQIFYGPDFTATANYPIPVPGRWDQSLAIGKIKISNNDYRTLIFFNNGGTLYAMKPEDGTNLWNKPCNNDAIISLADFNGDGWAEVLMGNRIYDAATGNILCDGGSSNNSGTTLTAQFYMAHPIAVDILGDENLELVAGNQIFAVSLNSSRAENSGSLTLISSVTPPSGCPNDGLTVVADFNNDGKLEVLVRTHTRTTFWPSMPWYLYLWTPHTGTNTGQILAWETDNHVMISVPFVGDIDGDGKVEIVTLASNGSIAPQKGFKARKYNPMTASFVPFWDIDHTDQSGATGMTLFDFNNDGISEIVYRDENELRILNGSLKSHITGQDTAKVYALNTFTSYSSTGYEYPIVVDLYNNQSSAILVTSDLKGPRDESAPGQGFDYGATIDIYTSSPSTPWAPARKVWNQYTYNAVNVNEDLTIPKYPLSPATVFAGADGILNTADDVRPYNGLFQQPTVLSQYGIPIWLAIDAEIINTPVMESYDPVGDSLSITVQIHNSGDASIRPPFYVSAYRGSVAAGNAMATDSINEDVSTGETKTVTIVIRNVSAYLPLSKVIVRLNDKGDAQNVQSECEYSYENELELESLLFLNNDMVTANMNDSVVFNVLSNDFYGDCNGGVPDLFDTLVNSGLHHGTLKINPADSAFTYIPDIGFFGVDSLTYYVKCASDSSAAKAYILVQKPLSQEYVACQGAVVTIGFTTINGVEYDWYEDDNGSIGDFIKTKDTIAVTKDNTQVQTFWAQAKYNDIVFPPYRVTVSLGDCGVTDPTGCAADGTVIWKEDFDHYDDGLNPASPAYSTEPLAMEMTTYVFKTVFTGGLTQDGTYGLPKSGGDEGYLKRYTDDHTSPDNPLTGRFLITNGRTSPDRVYRQVINNLCSGVDMYFSFWLGGQDAELKWTIYAEPSNEVLTTFTMQKLALSNPVWKQYGFSFTVPADVSSIRFEIYNNCTISGGNEVAYDDIEVRFCAPRVTTNIAGNDTTVCYGNDLNITGEYTDDGTFDKDLSYRWEFKHMDSVNWKTLASGVGMHTISQTVSITSATKADEGYYRLLVSSPANIGSVNCRAASDSVYVHVVDKYVAPDIRIQVCPSPPVRQIQLSSFLDSTDYNTVQWQAAPSGLPAFLDIETGLIEGMFQKGTYTYRYTLLSPPYSGCGETSAKAYVRVLDNRILSKTDTVVICQSLDASRAVQLNQIFGLALGGTLTYPNNPNNTVSNNVKVYTPPSKYAGAHVFNAQKAYSDDVGNNYGTTVKKFEFLYTGTCITGSSKKIVLIVTE